MSAHVEPSLVLTHAGAFAMLKGAIAMAAEMQVPACIAVVDAGGNLLAFLRMDGAMVLSGHAAIEKAVAAATRGAATGDGPGARVLTLASSLRVANPRGGLPILVDGRIVGGIGVDSTRAEQDVTLAQAGLACLQAGAAQAGVR